MCTNMTRFWIRLVWEMFCGDTLYSTALNLLKQVRVRDWAWLNLPGWRHRLQWGTFFTATSGMPATFSCLHCWNLQWPKTRLRFQDTTHTQTHRHTLEELCTHDKECKWSTVVEGVEREATWEIICFEVSLRKIPPNAPQSLTLLLLLRMG